MSDNPTTPETLDDVQARIAQLEAWLRGEPAGSYPAKSLHDAVRGLLAQVRALRAERDEASEAMQRSDRTCFRLAYELADAEKERGAAQEQHDVVEAARLRALDAFAEAARERDAARRTVGIFASIIRSGEPWTQTCADEYRRAMESAAETPDAGAQHG